MSVEYLMHFARERWPEWVAQFPHLGPGALKVHHLALIVAGEIELHPHRTSDPEGVIYLVKVDVPDHPGAVKLGRTTRSGLEARLAGIAHGLPWRLVVLGHWTDLHADVERRLHDALRDTRAGSLRGEWYDPPMGLVPGVLPPGSVAARKWVPRIRP